MDRWWLAAGIMLAIAGVRVCLWQKPVNIADGTVIRLRITVEKMKPDLAGVWGFEYRGIWIEPPKGVQVKRGNQVIAVGTIATEKPTGQDSRKRLNLSDFTIEEPKANRIEPIKAVNRKIRGWILSWLPGNSGALAAGILLGGDEELDPGTRENFRNSGLIHITAASGYNVAVVGSLVISVLALRLGKRRAIPFGIVCIGLYVMLAGATGAVIRAGIMVSVALAGKYWGRKSEGAWALFLSAWTMVMFWPAYAEDIGFQLSVAATTGVLAAGRSVRRGWWGDRENELRTTFAAQLMTIPIILHYFGNLSVWAPAVNLLVLWSVPWIMEIILAAVGLGLVLAPAGQLTAYLALPLLVWMEQVTAWSAGWRGNGWRVGEVSWMWVGGYYLAAGLIWLKVRRRGWV